MTSHTIFYLCKAASIKKQDQNGSSEKNKNEQYS